MKDLPLGRIAALVPEFGQNTDTDDDGDAMIFLLCIIDLEIEIVQNFY